MATTTIKTSNITNGSITAAKLAATGVTAGTYGSSSQTVAITVDAQGRITSASQSTLSTSNVTEGTNLYYTDARVGNYLTTNSYATQTYVTTAISNLIDAAPTTLDTLNELAAALNDDANFATTVSTALGNKLDASAYTASDVLTKIKTVDGAGSGLDSDTLDGQHGSYYTQQALDQAIAMAIALG